MHITKAWDWSKNERNKWLIPCEDCAFLAESWLTKGYRSFLDLGCGLGRHSVYMAQHGFCVTSCDLSEYGVNHLNEWAKRENLTIDTHICNMLELPFEDNSFDCIMAYNVIYHTDTNGFIAALHEIKRVLKPDGELYITLISKNTWSYQRAENYLRVDENTILSDENDATEKNVPHFYVDILDIKRLFVDWKYVKLPVEWCEYNMDDPVFFSKHWTLIVKKSV